MVIVEAQGISFQSHSGGKVDSIDEKLSLYVVNSINYNLFNFWHEAFFWSMKFYFLCFKYNNYFCFIRC